MGFGGAGANRSFVGDKMRYFGWQGRFHFVMEKCPGKCCARIRMDLRFGVPQGEMNFARGTMQGIC